MTAPELADELAGYTSERLARLALAPGCMETVRRAASAELARRYKLAALYPGSCAGCGAGRGYSTAEHSAPAADCRHTAWPGVNSCRDCGLSVDWRTVKPDADACPGCRADRGEPCREWCLSTVTDGDGQPVEDGCLCPDDCGCRNAALLHVPGLCLDCRDGVPHVYAVCGCLEHGGEWSL